MKIIFTLTVMLSFQALAAWDLNDVTYLMPLPARVEDNSLLELETPSKGGPLLPPYWVEKIPVLSLKMDAKTTQNALRVMAVRIDPCFPLPTPQSCQKQIRLVWQPIEKNLRQQVQTIDAALHSFYVLSDLEFASLLKDLAAWKTKHSVTTHYLPLQVHPAWALEGDQSPALAEFQTLITKYAGAANLTRITAMILRGNGDMWAFAGFEFQQGLFKMFPVPRLEGRTSQSFVNLAVPADHFTGGGMSPRPQGDDTLNAITDESQFLGAGLNETVLQEVRSAYRIENPLLYNPENTDCVSCHTARPAIQWALIHRHQLNVDRIWDSEIYKNAKYNLHNLTPEIWNTQNIRGLGYFRNNISISQRVINESAEVADYINKITN